MRISDWSSDVCSSDLQVVLGHPAVLDCVVVGIPHEKWGEMVTAAIEVKDGMSIDTAELLALCKERLGSIKDPKQIDIWPELPRSTAGKTLRRAVRRSEESSVGNEGVRTCESQWRLY